MKNGEFCIFTALKNEKFMEQMTNILIDLWPMLQNFLRSRVKIFCNKLVCLSSYAFSV
jgi:hypothetical protein